MRYFLVLLILEHSFFSRPSSSISAIIRLARSIMRWREVNSLDAYYCYALSNYRTFFLRRCGADLVSRSNASYNGERNLAPPFHCTHFFFTLLWPLIVPPLQFDHLRLRSFHYSPTPTQLGAANFKLQEREVSLSWVLFSRRLI